MASCRDCINWDECKTISGTTKYYGEESAAGNVESLCLMFEKRAHSIQEAAEIEVAREILNIITQRQELVMQRAQGTSNLWHCGHYTGKLLAYEDIKEIIEQKYLEAKE